MDDYMEMVGHKGSPRKSQRVSIGTVLLLAFLLRTVLMLLCDGFDSDVACFAAWSDNMVKYGADGFYTGGFFADYPPGYLYFLWGAGWLNRLLGIAPASVPGVYLLGLLPLLCDLALAWLAWRVTVGAGHEQAAVWVGGVVAFSPVLIFNLAVWKQVDSVLTLALVLCFLLLNRQKWFPAAAVYAIAVLIKPQALILGPVLALGYLAPLFKAQTHRQRLMVLLRTFWSALLCCSILFLGALPFQGTQGSFWLLQKYSSTASSYAYGTINAFNLFAALGGNWQPYADGFLLPYNQWGTLFILIATLLICYITLRAAALNRLNLPLLAGLYGIMIFTFAHSMHERYSIPFLLLLLFGWIGCRDKELFYCFGAQSLLSFFNVAAALWCLEGDTVYGSRLWELCIRLGGILQTLVCLWLIRCCLRIFCGSGARAIAHIRPMKPHKSSARAKSMIATGRAALPWTRRDLLFLLLPTLLCALISFPRLGSTQVPQTTWYSENGAVEVVFDPPAEVAQIWIYSGIGDGYLELVQPGDTETPLVTLETPFGNMYRWQVFDTSLTAERFYLHGYDAAVHELAFVDSTGETLRPDYISPVGQALFDEQSLRPDRPSSYTGMYFDEIYHGRTAYEHLTGMSPYENSHPPLGKLLIMAGIGIFGMNPFGWRFMGTLFGVLLVPLLYLLGRLLLDSREYALLGASLFALDFMRFTQSRIATIDTFAVFFILCSYLFMLYWLRQEHSALSMKSLLPLALSGVCFGLASAVKWVGIYSGIGLALFFFLHLWQERKEMDGQHYQRRVWSLLGLGVLFFVLIPIALYLISYLPYFLCMQHPYSLADVWGVQEFMLSYHGQLTETHPFESRWYSWPLILRPIWYSMGTHLPQGTVSSIALLGNPAIWWCSTAAMLGLLWGRLTGKRGQQESFLLIGYLSQLLPWVFITRSTFLYHYFPSLPFAILALCLTLQQLTQGRKKSWLPPLLLVAASAVLFVWFYPVLSDLPVSTAYAKSLMWLKGWQFYWL